MVGQVPEEKFQIILAGDIVSVCLPERLSVLEAVSFKTTCQNVIALNPPPKKIIFDFSQTIFIDSSGIGALISNLKTTKAKGIELVLKSVGSQVMAVFSLTSLDQVLTIEPPTADEKIKEKTRGENRLPVTHPSVRSWVKRLIDITGAIVGLSISSVLAIPIVIAIRLDSPGPIFFGQVRCGWMGKRFRIWKFRSMCTDAE
ncbi:MAG TPA: sugar transferase, partial [Candidatus Obscuribacterales bacterium]